MKSAILGLILVLFLSACSHKTDTEFKHSLTQSDKDELMSFVSHNTTNSVIAFTFTNGYAKIFTSEEKFVFAHGTNGWSIVERSNLEGSGLFNGNSTTN